jgi:uncharacterized membrane protein
MPAQYPASVRTFTNKVDLVDTVFADHVNILQDEVRALEVTFGNQVLVSTYTGTFAQTTSWSTVGARLANIEAGLVSGVVGSPYFKKTGDTISPASGSIALGLKTTAGTANLLEARNSANTLRFNINFDGLPKVGAANVLYVGSSEYTTLNTAATEANVIAKGNPFNPFLLAGM